MRGFCQLVLSTLEPGRRNLADLWKYEIREIVNSHCQEAFSINRILCPVRVGGLCLSSIICYNRSMTDQLHQTALDLPQAKLREKRRQILAIAKKYGAYNVRIFGSVARGEARPDSDIDFLVELEPGRSLFDLGGLLYELRSLLGVEVDVVTEKGLRTRIRERVLRDAVPL